MVAASVASQRPADARLLVIGGDGAIADHPRSHFLDFVRAGDLVIANDAATLPASLSGVHVRTGNPIEVRLAGRTSLRGTDVACFTAVVFGAGDYRTPTEHRPPPPSLEAGDWLVLGPLQATCIAVLGHPRLIALRFDDSIARIWEGLARHGRPIQYAHVPQPLAIWETWTSIASRPVAFEPPSAGFMLDWSMVDSLRVRGAAFATLTHAAGISSTGDIDLDRRLPLDEPYEIPRATAAAIAACRRRGGRVIAIGTTVVRALESAARADGTVRAGAGIATLRIGATTRLRCVDAVVSGTHEAGTSHYELLRAFQNDEVMQRMEAAANEHGYRTHEFGDSIFVSSRSAARRGRRPPRAAAGARLRASIPAAPVSP